VAALLKALDSRRFSRATGSNGGVEATGRLSLVELERVLEQQPTLEMRKRIEVVVDHVKSRERLRTLRAVEAAGAVGQRRGKEGAGGSGEGIARPAHAGGSGRSEEDACIALSRQHFGAWMNDFHVRTTPRSWKEA